MSTLSLRQLTLDLPSTRMSVNFDTFTTNAVTIPMPDGRARDKHTVARKPLPIPRNMYPPRWNGPAQSLSEIKEEPRRYHTPVSRHDSAHSSFEPDELLRTIQAAYTVSRTNSTTSTSTSSSVSRIHSDLQRTAPASITSVSSSDSSKFSSSGSNSRKAPLKLLDLPLSILEAIMVLVLPTDNVISIGPVSRENRNMRYRYHRPSLEYVDLGSALKHPLMSVSHHVRSVSLDVLYRRCELSVDFASIYYTKVSSTIDDNLKSHRSFWRSEMPNTVRNALRRASKLHIRLPVPSTEAGARRGRDEDDWMDGSDGQGGGSWRFKSMKREQEDAAEVQKCLEAVVKLLSEAPDEQPQSSGLRRGASLRRTKSIKSTISSLNQDGGKENIRSLKRLEITLVKRNPFVLVLPESLSLIRTLRSVPVSGCMEYNFELEGQKVPWASKIRGKWQQREPDGQILLQDLHGLSVAEKPIEPIVTPTQFKFVGVGRAGQLHLLDSALPNTPISLEKPEKPTEVLPDAPTASMALASRSVLRNPLTLFGKKGHKRLDSYTMIMAEGMGNGSSKKSRSTRKQPPTIEELKQIAEDIRNGLY